MSAYEVGNGWNLYAVKNGATQQLVTYTGITPSAGQTYRMKLSMRGTAISAYINGTQVLSFTDSSVTAAGKAGFFLTQSTDTTGLHLNFVCGNGLMKNHGACIGTTSI